MKYIIDIEDEYTKDWVTETPMCKKLCMPISVPNRQRTYHVVTGFKLEPYTEPDRKAIEDAQGEAWEFAKQVSIMKPKDKEECWGTAKYNTINFGYSYQEAKERYEVWKKSKSEVHLYDEIVSSVTDVKATIINISSWGQWNCINVDGAFSIDTDQQIFWEKTGRSFPELGELLKKMKEEEE